MKKILLCSVLCTALPIASAADWFYLLSEVGDRVVFFDKESVTKNDEAVTMWVRHIALSDSKPLGPNTFSYTSRVTYHCQKRTSLVTSGTFYNKKRETVGLLGQQKEQEIAPDTVGESLFKVACATGFPDVLPQKSALALSSIDTYDFAESMAEQRRNKLSR